MINRGNMATWQVLLVLVLVEDGRVHDELMVPHSLSNLFLNVFTVSAITTCSGSLFQ